MIVQPSAHLPGLEHGQAVSGAAFEERLAAANGARVLAKFASGDAAIVEKKQGRGTAVLIGSFAGLSYQRNHDPSTRALLLALAQNAGVEREVEVLGPGTEETEVRRLVSPDRQFVFVFNHSDAAVAAGISLHLPWRARTVRDITAGRELPVTHENTGTMLRHKLEPHAIWVVSLER